MKYVVIAFCIALVLLAIYILIKTIRSSLKGNSCSNCSGCSMRGTCSKINKKE